MQPGTPDYDRTTAQDPRLTRLRATFSMPGRTRVLTAFSGGVDSTLVAAVARQVLGRANAPVAVGDSASLPRRELAEVRRLAEMLDIDLIEVSPGEQDDPGYQANAGNRCFFCKTHLYDALSSIAAERGFTHLANGTNTDDLGDHRPGLQAAANAQVISPLVEAGLSKADVRDLAALLDLPNRDKPAAACLASRLPYGTPVTPQRLQQVEDAEEALHDLGFRGFRVRHHEQVARLEIPPEQWNRLLESDQRQRVAEALRRVGFLYVALDLEGFRSGSGNVALTISQRETDRLSSV